jgi:homocysteine S-methyltransferase
VGQDRRRRSGGDLPRAGAALSKGASICSSRDVRDVNEIGAAIRAVRRVCALPIVAQMTTGEDGNSLDGVAPESFVPDLEERGADVVGLNCSVGSGVDARDARADGGRRAREAGRAAHAGRPREIEGRNLYLSSAVFMASYARKFINSRRAPGRRLLRDDARITSGRS